ncbi:MAG: hypothetical protein IPN86_20865 [Saprospiraceae bacterium]|nr:hypothetical protein [Saprospiraceae bacterium]
MNTPGLKIEDVMKRVRIDVLKYGGQEPEERSKLNRDFYFNQKAQVLVNKPFENEEFIKNSLSLISDLLGEQNLDEIFSISFTDQETNDFLKKLKRKKEDAYFAHNKDVKPIDFGW